MSKRMIGIWAQDKRGVIGKNNRLPWHLPAELNHFKQTTMGQVILMGRVTFDGMKRRVLPGRTTIVLTTDVTYQVDDERVLVFHHIDDVLDWYQKQDRTLYVIGGAQMFQLFEPYLEALVLTKIDADISGDTYFPKEFSLDSYKEVDSTYYPADHKNSYDFTVFYLERKEY